MTNKEAIYNLLLSSGAMSEAEIRAELNISHGTFFAAKKELGAGGLIEDFLNGRILMYKAVKKKPPEPPVKPPAPAAAPAADKYIADEPNDDYGGFPRVTGKFKSYQIWLNKLLDTLGNYEIDDSAISSAVVKLIDKGGAVQRYKIVDGKGGEVTIS